MQALFAVHRPKTWDELVGHKTVKASVARMRDHSAIGGRAFWITGPSGCGKTTIAYLLAADVCDPDNFVELDAGEVTPARIDELERNIRCKAIGTKSGGAVIINEAQGLRKDTIRKLLVVLERIPNHGCWTFTTTSDGQQALFDGINAHPLLSRCIEFRLESNRYSAKFAERCKEIAEAEGLGGADMAEYIELAKRCQNNFRKMLCCIEAGELVREEVGV